MFNQNLKCKYIWVTVFETVHEITVFHMNIESARKKDFFQEVTLLCKIKGDTMNATFKNQLTILSGHEKDSIHIAVQQLFISSFSKLL